MNAFLIGGKLITDENDVLDIWANHFEDLGKPSVSPSFDLDFSYRAATHVRNIFVLCQNELPGTLNESLQYQEVPLVFLLIISIFAWRFHSMETTSPFKVGIFR